MRGHPALGGFPTGLVAQVIEAFRSEMLKRHLAGLNSFSSATARDNYFARWFPDGLARAGHGHLLARAVPSTSLKCRQCSTTRWRTLSSDHLCERCVEEPAERPSPPSHTSVR